MTFPPVSFNRLLLSANHHHLSPSIVSTCLLQASLLSLQSPPSVCFNHHFLSPSIISHLSPSASLSVTFNRLLLSASIIISCLLQSFHLSPCASLSIINLSSSLIQSFSTCLLQAIIFSCLLSNRFHLSPSSIIICHFQSPPSVFNHHLCLLQSFPESFKHHCHFQSSFCLSFTPLSLSIASFFCFNHLLLSRFNRFHLSPSSIICHFQTPPLLSASIIFSCLLQSFPLSFQASLSLSIASFCLSFIIISCLLQSFSTCPSSIIVTFNRLLLSCFNHYPPVSPSIVSTCLLPSIIICHFQSPPSSASIIISVSFNHLLLSPSIVSFAFIIICLQSFHLSLKHHYCHFQSSPSVLASNHLLCLLQSFSTCLLQASLSLSIASSFNHLLCFQSSFPVSFHLFPPVSFQASLSVSFNRSSFCLSLNYASHLLCLLQSFPPVSFKHNCLSIASFCLLHHHLYLLQSFPPESFKSSLSICFIISVSPSVCFKSSSPCLLHSFPTCLLQVIIICLLFNRLLPSVSFKHHCHFLLSFSFNTFPCLHFKHHCHFQSPPFCLLPIIISLSPSIVSTLSPSKHHCLSIASFCLRFNHLLLSPSIVSTCLLQASLSLSIAYSFCLQSSSFNHHFSCLLQASFSNLLQQSSFCLLPIVPPESFKHVVFQSPSIIISCISSIVSTCLLQASLSLSNASFSLLQSSSPVSFNRFHLSLQASLSLSIASCLLQSSSPCLLPIVSLSPSSIIICLSISSFCLLQSSSPVSFNHFHLSPSSIIICLSIASICLLLSPSSIFQSIIISCLLQSNFPPVSFKHHYLSLSSLPFCLFQSSSLLSFQSFPIACLLPIIISVSFNHSPVLLRHYLSLSINLSPVSLQSFPPVSFKHHCHFQSPLSVLLQSSSLFLQSFTVSFKHHYLSLSMPPSVCFNHHLCLVQSFNLIFNPFCLFNHCPFLSHSSIIVSFNRLLLYSLQSSSSFNHHLLYFNRFHLSPSASLSVTFNRLLLLPIIIICLLQSFHLSPAKQHYLSLSFTFCLTVFCLLESSSPVSFNRFLPVSFNHHCHNRFHLSPSCIIVLLSVFNHHLFASFCLASIIISCLLQSFPPDPSSTIVTFNRLPFCLHQSSSSCLLQSFFPVSFKHHCHFQSPPSVCFNHLLLSPSIVSLSPSSIIVFQTPPSVCFNVFPVSFNRFSCLLQASHYLSLSITSFCLLFNHLLCLLQSFPPESFKHHSLSIASICAHQYHLLSLQSFHLSPSSIIVTFQTPPSSLASNHLLLSPSIVSTCLLQASLSVTFNRLLLSASSSSSPCNHFSPSNISVSPSNHHHLSPSIASFCLFQASLSVSSDRLHLSPSKHPLSPSIVYLLLQASIIISCLLQSSFILSPSPSIIIVFQSTSFCLLQSSSLSPSIVSLIIICLLSIASFYSASNHLISCLLQSFPCLSFKHHCHFQSSPSVCFNHLHLSPSIVSTCLFQASLSVTFKRLHPPVCFNHPLCLLNRFPPVFLQASLSVTFISLLLSCFNHPLYLLQSFPPVSFKHHSVTFNPYPSNLLPIIISCLLQSFPPVSFKHHCHFQIASFCLLQSSSPVSFNRFILSPSSIIYPLCHFPRLLLSDSIFISCLLQSFPLNPLSIIICFNRLLLSDSIIFSCSFNHFHLSPSSIIVTFNRLLLSSIIFSCLLQSFPPVSFQASLSVTLSIVYFCLLQSSSPVSFNLFHLSPSSIIVCLSSPPFCLLQSSSPVFLQSFPPVSFEHHYLSLSIAASFCPSIIISCLFLQIFSTCPSSIIVLSIASFCLNHHLLSHSIVSTPVSFQIILSLLNASLCLISIIFSCLLQSFPTCLIQESLSLSNPCLSASIIISSSLSFNRLPSVCFQSSSSHVSLSNVSFCLLQSFSYLLQSFPPVSFKASFSLSIAFYLCFNILLSHSIVSTCLLQASLDLSAQSSSPVSFNRFHMSHSSIIIFLPSFCLQSSSPVSFNRFHLSPLSIIIVTFNLLLLSASIIISLSPSIVSTCLLQHHYLSLSIASFCLLQSSSPFVSFKHHFHLSPSSLQSISFQSLLLSASIISPVSFVVSTCLLQASLSLSIASLLLLIFHVSSSSVSFKSFFPCLLQASSHSFSFHLSFPPSVCFNHLLLIIVFQSPPSVCFNHLLLSPSIVSCLFKHHYLSLSIASFVCFNHHLCLLQSFPTCLLQASLSLSNRLLLLCHPSVSVSSFHHYPVSPPFIIISCLLQSCESFKHHCHFQSPPSVCFQSSSPVSFNHFPPVSFKHHYLSLSIASFCLLQSSSPVSFNRFHLLQASLSLSIASFCLLQSSSPQASPSICINHHLSTCLLQASLSLSIVSFCLLQSSSSCLLQSFHLSPSSIFFCLLQSSSSPPSVCFQIIISCLIQSFLQPVSFKHHCHFHSPPSVCFNHHLLSPSIISTCLLQASLSLSIASFCLLQSSSPVSFNHFHLSRFKHHCHFQSPPSVCTIIISVSFNRFHLSPSSIIVTFNRLLLSASIIISCLLQSFSHLSPSSIICHFQSPPSVCFNHHLLSPSIVSTCLLQASLLSLSISSFCLLQSSSPVSFNRFHLSPASLSFQASFLQSSSHCLASFNRFKLNIIVTFSPPSVCFVIISCLLQSFPESLSPSNAPSVCQSFSCLLLVSTCLLHHHFQTPPSASMCHLLSPPSMFYLSPSSIIVTFNRLPFCLLSIIISCLVQSFPPVSFKHHYLSLSITSFCLLQSSSPVSFNHFHLSPSSIIVTFNNLPSVCFNHHHLSHSIISTCLLQASLSLSIVSFCLLQSSSSSVSFNLFHLSPSSIIMSLSISLLRLSSSPVSIVFLSPSSIIIVTFILPPSRSIILLSRSIIFTCLLQASFSFNRLLLSASIIHHHFTSPSSFPTCLSLLLTIIVTFNRLLLSAYNHHLPVSFNRFHLNLSSIICHFRLTPSVCFNHLLLSPSIISTCLLQASLSLSITPPSVCFNHHLLSPSIVFHLSPFKHHLVTFNRSHTLLLSCFNHLHFSLFNHFDLSPSSIIYLSFQYSSLLSPSIIFSCLLQSISICLLQAPLSPFNHCPSFCLQSIIISVSFNLFHLSPSSIIVTFNRLLLSASIIYLQSSPSIVSTSILQASFVTFNLSPSFCLLQSSSPVSFNHFHQSNPSNIIVTFNRLLLSASIIISCLLQSFPPPIFKHHFTFNVPPSVCFQSSSLTSFNHFLSSFKHHCATFNLTLPIIVTFNRLPSASIIICLLQSFPPVSFKHHYLSNASFWHQLIILCLLQSVSCLFKHHYVTFNLPPSGLASIIISSSNRFPVLSSSPPSVCFKHLLHLPSIISTCLPQTSYVTFNRLLLCLQSSSPVSSIVSTCLLQALLLSLSIVSFCLLQSSSSVSFNLFHLSPSSIIICHFQSPSSFNHHPSIILSSLSPSIASFCRFIISVNRFKHHCHFQSPPSVCFNHLLMSPSIVSTCLLQASLSLSIFSLLSASSSSSPVSTSFNHFFPSFSFNLIACLLQSFCHFISNASFCLLLSPSASNHLLCLLLLCFNHVSFKHHCHFPIASFCLLQSSSPASFPIVSFPASLSFQSLPFQASFSISFNRSHLESFKHLSCINHLLLSPSIVSTCLIQAPLSLSIASFHLSFNHLLLSPSNRFHLSPSSIIVTFNRLLLSCFIISSPVSFNHFHLSPSSIIIITFIASFLPIIFSHHHSASSLIICLLPSTCPSSIIICHHPSVSFNPFLSPVSFKHHSLSVIIISSFNHFHLFLQASLLSNQSSISPSIVSTCLLQTSLSLSITSFCLLQSSSPVSFNRFPPVISFKHHCPFKSFPLNPSSIIVTFNRSFCLLQSSSFPTFLLQAPLSLSIAFCLSNHLPSPIVSLLPIVSHLSPSSIIISVSFNRFHLSPSTIIICAFNQSSPHHYLSLPFASSPSIIFLLQSFIISCLLPIVISTPFCLLQSSPCQSFQSFASPSRLLCFIIIPVSFNRFHLDPSSIILSLSSLLLLSCFNHLLLSPSIVYLSPSSIIVTFNRLPSVCFKSSSPVSFNLSTCLLQASLSFNVFSLANHHQSRFHLSLHCLCHFQSSFLSPSIFPPVSFKHHYLLSLHLQSSPPQISTCLLQHNHFLLLLLHHRSIISTCLLHASLSLPNASFSSIFSSPVFNRFPPSVCFNHHLQCLLPIVSHLDPSSISFQSIIICLFQSFHLSPSIIISPPSVLQSCFLQSFPCLKHHCLSFNRPTSFCHLCLLQSFPPRSFSIMSLPLCLLIISTCLIQSCSSFQSASIVSSIFTCLLQASSHFHPPSIISTCLLLYIQASLSLFNHSFCLLQSSLCLLQSFHLSPSSIIVTFNRLLLSASNHHLLSRSIVSTCLLQASLSLSISFSFCFNLLQSIVSPVSLHLSFPSSFASFSVCLLSPSINLPPSPSASIIISVSFNRFHLSPSSIIIVTFNRLLLCLQSSYSPVSFNHFHLFSFKHHCLSIASFCLLILRLLSHSIVSLNLSSTLSLSIVSFCLFNHHLLSPSIFSLVSFKHHLSITFISPPSVAVILSCLLQSFPCLLQTPLSLSIVSFCLLQSSSSVLQSFPPVSFKHHHCHFHFASFFCLQSSSPVSSIVSTCLFKHHYLSLSIAPSVCFNHPSVSFNRFHCLLQHHYHHFQSLSFCLIQSSSLSPSIVSTCLLQASLSVTFTPSVSSILLLESFTCPFNHLQSSPVSFNRFPPVSFKHHYLSINRLPSVCFNHHLLSPSIVSTCLLQASLSVFQSPLLLSASIIFSCLLPIISTCLLQASLYFQSPPSVFFNLLLSPSIFSTCLFKHHCPLKSTPLLSALIIISCLIQSFPESFKHVLSVLSSFLLIFSCLPNRFHLSPSIVSTLSLSIASLSFNRLLLSASIIIFNHSTCLLPLSFQSSSVSLSPSNHHYLSPSIASLLLQSSFLSSRFLSSLSLVILLSASIISPSPVSFKHHSVVAFQSLPSVSFNHHSPVSSFNHFHLSPCISPSKRLLLTSFQSSSSVSFNRFHLSPSLHYLSPFNRLLLSSSIIISVSFNPSSIIICHFQSPPSVCFIIFSSNHLLQLSFNHFPTCLPSKHHYPSIFLPSVCFKIIISCLLQSFPPVSLSVIILSLSLLHTASISFSLSFPLSPSQASLSLSISLLSASQSSSPVSFNRFPVSFKHLFLSILPPSVCFNHHLLSFNRFHLSPSSIIIIFQSPPSVSFNHLSNPSIIFSCLLSILSTCLLQASLSLSIASFCLLQSLSVSFNRFPLNPSSIIVCHFQSLLCLSFNHLLLSPSIISTCLLQASLSVTFQSPPFKHHCPFNRHLLSLIIFNRFTCLLQSLFPCLLPHQVFFNHYLIVTFNRLLLSASIIFYLYSIISTCLLQALSIFHFNQSPPFHLFYHLPPSVSFNHFQSFPPALLQASSSVSFNLPLLSASIIISCLLQSFSPVSFKHVVLHPLSVIIFQSPPSAFNLLQSSSPVSSIVSTCLLQASLSLSIPIIFSLSPSIVPIKHHCHFQSPPSLLQSSSPVSFNLSPVSFSIIVTFNRLLLSASIIFSCLVNHFHLSPSSVIICQSPPSVCFNHHLCLVQSFPTCLLQAPILLLSLQASSCSLSILLQSSSLSRSFPPVSSIIIVLSSASIIIFSTCLPSSIIICLSIVSSSFLSPSIIFSFQSLLQSFHHLSPSIVSLSPFNRHSFAPSLQSSSLSPSIVSTCLLQASLSLSICRLLLSCFNPCLLPVSFNLLSILSPSIVSPVSFHHLSLSIASFCRLQSSSPVSFNRFPCLLQASLSVTRLLLSSIIISCLLQSFPPESASIIVTINRFPSVCFLISCLVFFHLSPSKHHYHFQSPPSVCFNHPLLSPSIISTCLLQSIIVLSIFLSASHHFNRLLLLSFPVSLSIASFCRLLLQSSSPVSFNRFPPVSSKHHCHFQSPPSVCFNHLLCLNLTCLLQSFPIRLLPIIHCLLQSFSIIICHFQSPHLIMSLSSNVSHLSFLSVSFHPSFESCPVSFKHHSVTFNAPPSVCPNVILSPSIVPPVSFKHHYCHFSFFQISCLLLLSPSIHLISCLLQSFHPVSFKHPLSSFNILLLFSIPFCLLIISSPSIVSTCLLQASLSLSITSFLSASIIISVSFNHFLSPSKHHFTFKRLLLSASIIFSCLLQSFPPVPVFVTFNHSSVCFHHLRLLLSTESFKHHHLCLHYHHLSLFPCLLQASLSVTLIAFFCLQSSSPVSFNRFHLSPSSIFVTFNRLLLCFNHHHLSPSSVSLSPSSIICHLSIASFSLLQSSSPVSFNHFHLSPSSIIVTFNPFFSFSSFLSSILLSASIIFSCLLQSFPTLSPLSLSIASLSVTFNLSPFCLLQSSSLISFNHFSPVSFKHHCHFQSCSFCLLQSSSPQTFPCKHHCLLLSPIIIVSLQSKHHCRFQAIIISFNLSTCLLQSLSSNASLSFNLISCLLQSFSTCLLQASLSFQSPPSVCFNHHLFLLQSSVSTCLSFKASFVLSILPFHPVSFKHHCQFNPSVCSASCLLQSFSFCLLLIIICHFLPSILLHLSPIIIICLLQSFPPVSLSITICHFQSPPSVCFNHHLLIIICHPFCLSIHLLQSFPPNLCFNHHLLLHPCSIVSLNPSSIIICHFQSPPSVCFNHLLMSPSIFSPVSFNHHCHFQSPPSLFQSSSPVSFNRFHPVSFNHFPSIVSIITCPSIVSTHHCHFQSPASSSPCLQSSSVSFNHFHFLLQASISSHRSIVSFCLLQASLTSSICLFENHHPVSSRFPVSFKHHCFSNSIIIIFQSSILLLSASIIISCLLQSFPPVSFKHHFLIASFCLLQSSCLLQFSSFQSSPIHLCLQSFPPESFKHHCHFQSSFSVPIIISVSFNRFPVSFKHHFHFQSPPFCHFNHHLLSPSIVSPPVSFNHHFHFLLSFNLSSPHHCHFQSPPSVCFNHHLLSLSIVSTCLLQASLSLSIASFCLVNLFLSPSNRFHLSPSSTIVTFNLPFCLLQSSSVSFNHFHLSPSSISVTFNPPCLLPNVISCLLQSFPSLSSSIHCRFQFLLLCFQSSSPVSFNRFLLPSIISLSPSVIVTFNPLSFCLQSSSLSLRRFPPVSFNCLFFRPFLPLLQSSSPVSFNRFPPVSFKHHYLSLSFFSIASSSVSLSFNHHLLSPSIVLLSPSSIIVTFLLSNHPSVSFNHSSPSLSFQSPSFHPVSFNHHIICHFQSPPSVCFNHHLLSPSIVSTCLNPSIIICHFQSFPPSICLSFNQSVSSIILSPSICLLQASFHFQSPPSVCFQSSSPVSFNRFTCLLSLLSLSIICFNHHLLSPSIVSTCLFQASLSLSIASFCLLQSSSPVSFNRFHLSPSIIIVILSIASLLSPSIITSIISIQASLLSLSIASFCKQVLIIFSCLLQSFPTCLLQASLSLSIASFCLLQSSSPVSFNRFYLSPSSKHFHCHRFCLNLFLLLSLLSIIICLLQSFPPVSFKHHCQFSISLLHLLLLQSFFLSFPSIVSISCLLQPASHSSLSIAPSVCFNHHLCSFNHFHLSPSSILVVSVTS
ncbi:unnamed protein product [Acanthosepion pharaonis]|uniref:Fibronectin type-III domain-containing protein n=1 Tax=Acanthosepion pharaonis TaxID=158019 RepID=A0A812B3W6_ACAPH|nr:unnamed protein product [Sepia pharaonis]